MTKELLTKCGVGLRVEHLDSILSELPPIGWFELLGDNHINEPYVQRKKVDRVAERYPVTLHSVGLSLGSTDELDKSYLAELKKLIYRFNPIIVSEHLCWTSVHGHHFHDLMPLPYTEETIEHVVGRIKAVQDFLGFQILIENVSSYLQYTMSEMTEWEFISEIAERSDCFILLDVNNIFVSSHNHDFDPLDYIRGVPGERVKEIHLAGHTEVGSMLLDSHSGKIAPEVEYFYITALRRFGVIPTLIEWDNDIPPMETLVEEASQIDKLLAACNNDKPQKDSASLC
jgi:uncharacterized protein